MANAAYARILADILPEERVPRPFALTAPPRLNLLRLLFAPDGHRSRLLNWEAVAAAVLTRVRGEIGRDGDAARRALLAEIERSPDLPQRATPPDAVPDLVIPVELRRGEGILRLLSTIAVLGTAQDITLQDLRIEIFYPADAEAERLAQAGPR